MTVSGKYICTGDCKGNSTLTRRSYHEGVISPNNSKLILSMLKEIDKCCVCQSQGNYLDELLLKRAAIIRRQLSGLTRITGTVRGTVTRIPYRTDVLLGGNSSYCVFHALKVLWLKRRKRQVFAGKADHQALSSSQFANGAFFRSFGSFEVDCKKRATHQHIMT